MITEIKRSPQNLVTVKFEERKSIGAKQKDT